MWFKKKMRLKELQCLCKEYVKVDNYKEYFKNDVVLNKNNTKIIFKYENDTYGVNAKIFYKDTLIAEMDSYGYIKIFYNPCNEIIKEINQDIDYFIYPNSKESAKDKKERRKEQQRINKSLSFKF